MIHKRNDRVRTRLRVGLTHNLKRIDPTRDDTEAEFDSPKTIRSIAGAIESFGHRVVPLEARPDIVRTLPAARVDLVFNIAEGVRGRNREAQIPALCELLGIPYTGSDAATLAITLDKALSKRLLRDARVPTPDFILMETGREPIPARWTYPAIVKPNLEGTSKGITAASVVDDERALRRTARSLIRRYKQPAIVEAFVSGREFTVGIVGDRPARVLPPMEVVFLHPSRRDVYEFSLKQDWTGRLDYVCPARLGRDATRRMQRLALETFRALGCRDVARVDFRTDRRGRPFVIEVNPLPGLTPNYSDLVMIGDASGLPYRDLIGAILECGIRRMREGSV